MADETMTSERSAALAVMAHSLAERAGLCPMDEDEGRVAPWLADALKGILRRAHRQVSAAALSDPTAKTPEDAWTADEVVLASMLGVHGALLSMRLDPAEWLG
ncbi:MAG: hypothetical protein ABIJ48_11030 [Actinomycetota bacterium]